MGREVPVSEKKRRPRISDDIWKSIEWSIDNILTCMSELDSLNHEWDVIKNGDDSQREKALAAKRKWKEKLGSRRKVLKGYFSDKVILTHARKKLSREYRRKLWEIKSDIVLLLYKEIFINEDEGENIKLSCFIEKYPTFKVIANVLIQEVELKGKRLQWNKKSFEKIIDSPRFQDFYNILSEKQAVKWEFYISSLNISIPQHKFSFTKAYHDPSIPWIYIEYPGSPQQ